MPEEKAPDETVAQSDEEDRQDPRSVAYVQKHAYNGQRVVFTIRLSRLLFAAIQTSISGIFLIVHVGFLRLRAAKRKRFIQFLFTAGSIFREDHLGLVEQLVGV